MGGERLDPLARVLGERLARVDDKRAACRIRRDGADGQRALARVNPEAEHVVRACARGGDDLELVGFAEREADRGSLDCDDLERVVHGDALDVVARPRRDERGRSLAERLLAPLGPLMARHNAGEPHDHEHGERRRGADDDEKLAASVPQRGDREHRRGHERCRREHRKTRSRQPFLGIRVRLGELDHGGMQCCGAQEDC